MKAQDQISNVKKRQNKKLPTITQSTQVYSNNYSFYLWSRISTPHRTFVYCLCSFNTDTQYCFILATHYVPCIITYTSFFTEWFSLYTVRALHYCIWMFHAQYFCFFKTEVCLKQNVFSDMWIKLFLKVFNYYDIVSHQNYCSYLLHFHCKYFCQSGHWSLSR